MCPAAVSLRAVAATRARRRQKKQRENNPVGLPLFVVHDQQQALFCIIDLHRRHSTLPLSHVFSPIVR